MSFHKNIGTLELKNCLWLYVDVGWIG